MSTAADAGHDLELISHVLCPYVHRAAAVLHEKGVAYGIRYIDLKAKPDWFLKLSPRGKVPVLVTQGVPIFESSVIVEYLDETQPPPLLPASPLEKARQRGWVEVVNDLFALQWKLMNTKDGERAAALAAVREVLARFEPEVRGPWFAGEALGVVDIAIAPAFLRFALLDEWWQLGLYGGLPGVAAWAERLVARPSVRATVVADFDERFRAYVEQLGGAR